jgi:hypothetical protein
MTTVSGSIIQCGICNRENAIIVYPSIFSSGPSDLDSRPPVDYRFVLQSTFVTRCKYCGYCNKDLLPIINAEEIMKSDEYLEQLNNNDFPEKANSFLCKSLILELSGNVEEASYAALHAAWTCDDIENHYNQSNFCRRKAIRLFSIAGALNEYLNLSWPNLSLILSDLHRRIRDFKMAETICLITLRNAVKSNNHFSDENASFLINAIKYELYLSKKMDSGIYTFRDSETFMKEQ